MLNVPRVACMARLGNSRHYLLHGTVSRNSYTNIKLKSGAGLAIVTGDYIKNAGPTDDILHI